MNLRIKRIVQIVFILSLCYSFSLISYGYNDGEKTYCPNCGAEYYWGQGHNCPGLDNFCSDCQRFYTGTYHRCDYIYCPDCKSTYNQDQTHICLENSTLTQSDNINYSECKDVELSFNKYSPSYITKDDSISESRNYTVDKNKNQTLINKTKNIDNVDKLDSPIKKEYKKIKSNSFSISNMPGFKNSPINKAVDSFKNDFKSGGNWLYTPNNGDELKARRDFILGASNLITPFFS